jgi:hypothetical protein
MTDTCTCNICEFDVEEDDVKHIEIKGKVKNICKECLDSIKGLV